MDKTELINNMHDRSLRAVMDILAAENMTQDMNYQTSFYVDALDEVLYSTSQYNWTEFDMVFLQKGELPIRIDKMLELQRSYGNVDPNDPTAYQNFMAYYKFNINIENYNRLYHFRDLIPKYTTKQMKQNVLNGVPMEIFNTSSGEDEIWYSYIQPGNEGDTNGGVKFEFVFTHTKTKYWDWVNNWIYSYEQNIENSPCLPPYDDFENTFCYDLMSNFTSNDEAPMIFKCYTGLLPFYCPWDLPFDDFSI